MIEVVVATQEHAAAMAPVMRQEDAEEVVALGMSPIEALSYSLAASRIAHTALIDGKPAAMWGACPESLLGEKALLWMLGTDHVPRNAKALLRMSRAFVAHIQAQYPILECFVDMRYHAAVRWVAWLGFEHAGTATINGMPFVAYQRKR